jgi:hypothetical protein
MSASTRGLLLALPLVSSLLLLPGCASAVSHDFRVRRAHDANVDFSAYTSYGWLAPEPTGDPRLDNTPFRLRVQGAVEEVLQELGYTKNEEDPSFWITYQPLLEGATSAELRTTYETTPVTLDGWEELYPEDCLLLDVVHGLTAQLAWRGIVDDPDEELLLGGGTVGRERLTEAVRFLLSEFPPD